MKPLRLDAELVRRGLAGSRGEAKRLVDAGKVSVRGLAATGASSLVAPDAPITLSPAARARFVSRAGDKLEGALARFSVPVSGRRWLDAGASTGGFTDCLLQRGAHAVVAVDVGYGQLDWKLRNDRRVVVLERTNVRHLSPDDLPWRADGVVADLSFISLRLVLPALASVAARRADHVLLVKPQFEVGRRAVGRRGVVREPEAWLGALKGVVEAGAKRGLGLLDAAVADPPGPAGNREFFVHLRAGVRSDDAALRRAVAEAGP
ncbi:MAG: TlyA family RNA methyltransferase [Actinomycetota bacterium]